MSEHPNYKISHSGIQYLDFSDFINTPCGTILRNDRFSQTQLMQFISGFHYSKINNDNIKKPGKLSLIELNQKHTPVVIAADLKYDKPADGVYTNSADYILVIKTADCFPVFLYDGSTVGLLHVGWRGALRGIIDNFFSQAPDFNHSQAKAAIGPGIGSCCFEVSPEAALLFDKKYRLRKKGNFFIDLKRFIVDELTRFEIQYILDNDVCTVCDTERFYSYRREGKKVKKLLSYICTGGTKK